MRPTQLRLPPPPMLMLLVLPLLLTAFSPRALALSYDPAPMLDTAIDQGTFTTSAFTNGSVHVVTIAVESSDATGYYRDHDLPQLPDPVLVAEPVVHGIPTCMLARVLRADYIDRVKHRTLQRTSGWAHRRGLQRYSIARRASLIRSVRAHC